MILFNLIEIKFFLLGKKKVMMRDVNLSRDEKSRIIAVWKGNECLFGDRG